MLSKGKGSAKLKDSLPQARSAYFYFLKDLLIAFLVFYPNLLCFSGDYGTYFIYCTWAHILVWLCYAWGKWRDEQQHLPWSSGLYILTLCLTPFTLTYCLLWSIKHVLLHLKNHSTAEWPMNRMNLVLYSFQGSGVWADWARWFLGSM